MARVWYGPQCNSRMLWSQVSRLQWQTRWLPIPTEIPNREHVAQLCTQPAFCHPVLGGTILMYGLTSLWREHLSRHHMAEAVIWDCRARSEMFANCMTGLESELTLAASLSYGKDWLALHQLDQPRSSVLKYFMLNRKYCLRSLLAHEAGTCWQGVW